MDQNRTNWRNDALEFAKATRQNLKFIEKSKDRGYDVHVVTQLVLSLLGLVVFPKEKLSLLADEVKQMTIPRMASEGWPTWTITNRSINI